MKLVSWLAIGAFATVIALCHLASFRFINPQTTLLLLIFNAFFISLFFFLNGNVPLKAGMLATGNILGLCWNLFFYFIQSTSSGYFGVPFNAFFTLIYPILNLMWIVPFCSLTLSSLPKLAPKILEGQT